MATSEESTKMAKEKEIPVLTVLKNNCILKNIYLLNNPPSISSTAENEIQESVIEEETIIVGRHPDCGIKLEHPSVSRFHLRIHSKPSSRSLHVTDLNSVHGTWISGKKVEPEVRMKLNEGDTLQLGASSRLYRLHWIPISRAYDIDNPFVPQLDSDIFEEKTKEEIYQDAKSFSVENDQVKTLSENVEGLEFMFTDGNLWPSVQEPSPSAAVMLQDLCKFSEKEVAENKSSSRMLIEENQENSTPRRVLFPPESQTASQMDIQESSGMKSNLSIWSRRGKSNTVQIETSQNRGKSVKISSPTDSLAYENRETEFVLKNHFDSPDIDEQIYTPDKENRSPHSIVVGSLSKKGQEALKLESLLNTPMSSLDLDEEEIFTPDKENMTPNTRLLRSIRKMGDFEEVKDTKSYRSSSLKRSVKSNMSKEEATYLPSLRKVNQHGNVLQERKSTSSASKSRVSLKKASNVLKSGANRDPFRPLPVNSSGNKEANSKPSVNEVTQRSGKSVKQHKPEEVLHSHNNTKGEEKKQWTVVVDTASLMNEKSRKALELLRGLKGTSLIIPRIVVRELDCMIRRRGFFTRMTEVSAALQLIEDCMANTKWWIHVQTSAEEGMLIPPTPPASPRWFSEDKGATFNFGSNPFSPHSLQEIVTPTAEDHILECALFFKRTRSNGQLVLLSNDVTLKIKAMAEGVICETAEDFRGSLVNPFSERFLYSDSSPRGATWSCADDAVLKDRYYPSPSKKLTKSGEGGVKGLKLILMHNSNFRQNTTIS